MKILSLLTGIGALVMGGVFFSFSAFLMKALNNLQPADGIRAMQQINLDVLSLAFMSLFFALPLAAAILMVSALAFGPQPQSAYHLVGGAIYLAGSFLVTVLGNVPMNNSLARQDASGSDAEQYWRRYVVQWTRWNHLRTGACVSAGVVLIIAGQ